MDDKGRVFSIGLNKVSLPIKDKNSFEFVFCGYPGTGVSTAGKVLSETAILDGWNSQLFPIPPSNEIGPYVISCVRISKNNIFPRDIHLNPDFLILFDINLWNHVVGFGSGNETILIINSPKSVGDIKRLVKSDAKILSFNATELSEYFLGKNFPNLVILGALFKVFGRLSLSSAENSLREKYKYQFGQEMVEKNAIAMRMGFNEMTQ